MKLAYGLFSSLCLSTILLVFPNLVMANPQDGVVKAGQASISQSGSKLDIKQQSNKAVIDWREFNIAPDEHTQFYQPGNNSITMNRVNSGAASQIDGKLTANGNVFIVNQNGLVFGKGAKVDVNGMVATTADIDNNKFMNNDILVFDKPGNPDAKIINEGQITAKQAGLVGFVAPHVANSGIISAKLGRVQLSSGDTTTVDMYGDGLMKVAVSDKVKSQLVSNTGTIEANGGKIALTAAAGKNILNSLITQSGALKAQSVSQKNGEIIIAAEGSNAVKNNIAGNKGKKQGESTVLVNGLVDVSGTKPSEKGGKVTVTGDNIALQTAAHINANGQAGGGTVLVGGDYKGEGKTPTAKRTIMEEGSRITANSTHAGDGGKVILWADDRTDFAGAIRAKGGAFGGNGGFVETSGKNFLRAVGTVDLTAAQGKIGTWLLDPTDITLYSRTGTGDGVNSFTTAQLETMSVGADVALAATNDIIFNFATPDTAVFTSDRNFTLTAGNDIYSNAGTTGASTFRTQGTGAITLEAGRDINIVKPFSFTSSTGNIRFNANRNVIHSTTAALTTSGGAIILNSDRDQATASGGSIFISGITLNSGGGNITIGGGLNPEVNYAIGDASNGGANCALLNCGAYLGNSTITAGGGNIIVKGQGGTNATGYNQGIYKASGNITTNGAGTILLDGIAGTTGNNNYGISYGAALIETANGLLTLQGQSTGAGTSSRGVSLVGNVTVRTTGLGNLIIDGSSSADNGIGVYFTTSFGSYGIYTTNAGNINITGTSNSATGTTGKGVFMDRVVIGATGSGNLSIAGTVGASASSNYGLNIFGTANNNIYTTSGNLTLTGIAPASTNGLYFDDTAGAITYFGNGSQTGDITLKANQIFISRDETSFTTLGNIFIQPYTAGTGMSVGTNVASTLNIPTTYFTSSAGSTALPPNTAVFNWGTNKVLNFGGGVAGKIDIDTNYSFVNPVAFQNQSGSNIELDNNLTSANTGTAFSFAAGGDFLNAGNRTISMGAGGRWLIYTPDTTGNNFGALLTATNDFRRYNCTYGGACPALGTGDGFLYSMSPPALTVTPTSTYSVTYGDAAPNLTNYSYNITGYLAGDSGFDNVTGTLNGATTYVAGSPVTSYALNHDGISSLTSELGYTFSYASLSNAISVIKRVITAQVGSTAITYGDNAPTLTAANVTWGNLYNNTNPTGTINFSYGGYAPGSNIGTYALGISSFSDTNYDLTLPGGVTNGTLTVGQRGLTISGISAANKVYDGNLNATLSGTGSLTGVIAGDAGLVTLDTASASALFGDKNVADNKAVTASGYTLGGAKAANYTISQPTGLVANITAKALTASLIGGPITKVYDGDNTTTLASGNYSLVGLVGMDAVTASGTATYDTKNVGTGKTITSTGLSLGGADAGNYSISGNATGNIGTITARPITVSAVTHTKAYDGTTTAGGTPTLTSGSLAVGDSATYIQSYSTAAAGAGNKTLIANASITDGNSGNNYAITYDPFTTGTINRANLTITANNQTNTYGVWGAPADLGTTAFTAGATQNGELVDNVVFSTNATLSPSSKYNAGTWTLTPGTATGSNGFLASNYNITYNNALTGLIINQAPLTVTADAATRVENDPDPVFSATITGFVGSENLATSGVTGTANFATNAILSSPAGAYSITPSVGSLAATNYSFGPFVDGILTVTAGAAPPPPPPPAGGGGGSVSNPTPPVVVVPPVVTPPPVVVVTPSPPPVVTPPVPVEETPVAFSMPSSVQFTSQIPSSNGTTSTTVASAAPAEIAVNNAPEVVNTSSDSSSGESDSSDDPKNDEHKNSGGSKVAKNNAQELLKISPELATDMNISGVNF